MADNPSPTPSSSSTTVPVGVKVISILYYIGAALALIFAIIMFVGASFAAAIFPSLGSANMSSMASLGSTLAIVAGVVCIIAAAIDFAIGFFLWKLKKWARIVAIVLGCLSVVGAIINFAMLQFVPGVIGLIIGGFIAGYLLFAKDAKAAFG
jgi:hypothetical protein